MMTQKPPGDYPVNLNEISAVIAALVKFKRIIDHNGNPANYDIFDEPPEYDVNEQFLENNKFLVNHAEESIAKPETVEFSVDLF